MKHNWPKKQRKHQSKMITLKETPKEPGNETKSNDESNPSDIVPDE